MITLKVVHHRNLGLTARAKLSYQAASQILIAIALIALQHRRVLHQAAVPFLSSSTGPLIQRWAVIPPSGRWLLPFVAVRRIVIVGSSNAVNLTEA